MKETETTKKPAISTAKSTGNNGGESVSLMEPLVLSEGSRPRPALMDLALALASRSAGLRRSLPEGIVTALAGLVRSMNCYYSNLIEGHDTHPIDIERALKKDYSSDPRKRVLQREAEAHIAVQKWIDEGGLKGRAVRVEGILEVHRRFCELLPADLLVVERAATNEKLRVVPGEVRKHDVAVGAHVPVSAGAVPRCLARFEEVYSKLGPSEAVLAVAAAHHRLAWIHPFLDGNGRVVRLMSYATLLDTLETGGVWSIARGLARSVDRYKGHLAVCDTTRRNDLDGRRHLSEEALAEFTRYFLETCVEQVRFMEELVQPERLRIRIGRWVAEEVGLGTLREKSSPLLDSILYRGEIPRGEVPRTLDVSERTANRVVADLVARGVLTSQTPKAPLRLTFPATLASYWMPGLFPEQRE
jgi:Fic family protein